MKILEHRLHHITTQNLFYSDLKRFVFFIFFVPLTPILMVMVFSYLYPHFDVKMILTLLVFAYLCLAGAATCIYAITHHASIHKSLKPVSDLAHFGDLAAKVAHDLRSPLAGIQSAVKSFQKISHQNPSATHSVKLLEMSSRRLKGIAEDLLNSHQERAIAKQPINLHQLLDRLILEFSSQQGYAQIQFRKHYGESPLIFPGYEQQILRVFQNLFKNASEAMRFTGDIIVRTETRDPFALISVRDSGPGMSPQVIQKILSGPYTEGKKDGHGLGLAYVREVLERHGGKLSIESNSGQGACFQIKLPLREVSSAEKPSALAEYSLR